MAACAEGSGSFALRTSGYVALDFVSLGTGRGWVGSVVCYWWQLHLKWSEIHVIPQSYYDWDLSQLVLPLQVWQLQQQDLTALLREPPEWFTLALPNVTSMWVQCTRAALAIGRVICSDLFSSCFSDAQKHIKHITITTNSSSRLTPVPTAPASACLGASAGGSGCITFPSSGFEGKQKNHTLLHLLQKNIRCQIYEILTNPYKLLTITRVMKSWLARKRTTTPWMQQAPPVNLDLSQLVLPGQRWRRQQKDLASTNHILILLSQNCRFWSHPRYHSYKILEDLEGSLGLHWGQCTRSQESANNKTSRLVLPCPFQELHNWSATGVQPPRAGKTKFNIHSNAVEQRSIRHTVARNRN